MKTRIKILCINWKNERKFVYTAQRKVFWFLWTDCFPISKYEVVSCKSKSRQEVDKF